MHRLIFRVFRKGKPTENQATYFSNVEKPIHVKDRGVSVIYINDNFLQPVNSEHIQIVKGLDIDEVIEKYGLNQDESIVVRNMFRDYGEEVQLTGLGGHVESCEELGEETFTQMIKGYRTRLMRNKLLSFFKYSYYKPDEDDIIRPTKSKSSGRIKDIFGWPLDDTNISNKLLTSFASLKASTTTILKCLKSCSAHSIKIDV